MITKDDEKSFEKILENYDPISRKEFLDSIAIARQMSKPKNEKKNIIEDITVPKTPKEDLPKVNEVPKSTNLINKTAANIKSTASNVVNNAKTSAPATMVKEIGAKATEDAKTAILNKKMEEDLKAKANAILPQKTATTTAPSTTAPAKISTPAVSPPVKSTAPATTAPAKVAPATTTSTSTPSTTSPSTTTTTKPSMTIETPAATTPEPKKRSARLVIEE
jgi:cell division septation protein DedD